MKKSGPRENNCRNFSAPSSGAEETRAHVPGAVRAGQVDDPVKVARMDGQVKVDPVDARGKVARVDGQVKAVAAAVLTAKECAPLC